jgi:hypothetical protein
VNRPPVTLEEHREAGNTVERWAITNVYRDGERKLTFPCQGRYTEATEAEALASLAALLENNTAERLASVFGPQAIGTFKASRVECWAGHFDPVGIYWQ